MSTLLFQISTSVLLLLTGVVALVVASRVPVGAGLQRTTWRLTGVVFTAMAASMAAQDIAAVRAFLSGPGSSFYDGYLRWSPVANHGRTFFAAAFHLVLLMLSLRASVPDRRFWFISGGTLVLSFVIGGVVGWAEGSILSRVHYSDTAIFDTVAFFLLLGALLAALVRNTMDWVLWSCILLYAFVLGLGVLWHAALAWIRVPGAWAPSPVSLHLYRNLMMLAILGLAVYRLHRLRRGVPVRGLLERFPQPRTSLFH